MRHLAAVAVLLLLLAGPGSAAPPVRPSGPRKPAAAPEAPTPSTKPILVKNEACQVEVTFPAGWAKEFEGTKGVGSWVELARFTEPRSKAVAMLSYQASAYSSSEQLFAALKKQFRSNSGWVVIRTEIRAATNHRPKGIFFEYTFKGSDGPQHAVAAFWLYLGKLYRVYGYVREVGWRAVASDFESLVSSFTLTSRAFSSDVHNFRDDAGNYQMYFPESFRVRLPASGPRVVFESDRLGIAVWVYVNPARGTLTDCRDRLVKALETDRAEVKKKTEPEVSPSLGIPVVELDYVQQKGQNTFRYRETVLLHRNRQYRLILVASQSRFTGGEEIYQRMVRSLSFFK